jgi:N utilization substance protein B
MPARRKSRQRAIQILFLWDVRKLPIDQAIEAYYESLFTSENEEEKGEEADGPAAPDAFMEALARGTAGTVVELDALITQRAENWRLERMPVVDRNILRMAVYEMKQTGTPHAVVIDEALELARRFTELEAIPFLNGVLDGVRKLLVSGVAGESAS